MWRRLPGESICASVLCSLQKSSPTPPLLEAGLTQDILILEAENANSTLFLSHSGKNIDQEQEELMCGTHNKPFCTWTVKADDFSCMSQHSTLKAKLTFEAGARAQEAALKRRKL